MKPPWMKEDRQLTRWSPRKTTLSKFEQLILGLFLFSLAVALLLSYLLIRCEHELNARPSPSPLPRLNSPDAQRQTFSYKTFHKYPTHRPRPTNFSPATLIWNGDFSYCKSRMMTSGIMAGTRHASTARPESAAGMPL
jgi:hypothetical protein